MPVAFVTGAARGIGRACAVALAREGYDIAVGTNVSDTSETLAEVRACGRQAVTVTCNVGDAAARAAALEQIRAAFGQLHLLVNNAGVAPKVRADILDATEESFDYVVGTNLRGPYFLSQAAAKWMIEQKRARPVESFGIVNIGSISAWTASVTRGDYCVSKAGIAMMTKLFAARLAGEGVYVYEIQPGIVKTDMTKVVTEKYDKLIAEGLTPIRSWVLPEHVGTAVAACATGRIPLTTGQVLNIDGGFHLRTL
jgi:NAD(P)-dependent dehydrogenase (short-subunit alcohol dehydrogenase family)